MVARGIRLNYDSFAAYKLENTVDGTDNMKNLMDEESHMISTDYIDEVSSITNMELERLLDKEMDE